MAQGRIKKIMRDRGFGFIAGSGGKDVYFHRSTVADDGFDMLEPGQTVEFEIAEQARNDKGPRARCVAPPSKAAMALQRMFQENM
ncbi:MAG TPA: cold shock domain-containing protein [Pirellulales bacterium]|nr:cold shock domain-containing protein [Pirellulales bacterium]